MNKTEALAILEARIPALDAEQAAVLAEIAQAMNSTPMEFTDADHAGIARGRADLAAGRSFASVDARARSAELAAKRRDTTAK